MCSSDLLTVTTGPFARTAFPAGLKRGAKSPLALVGWNLPAAATQTVDASHAQPADQTLFLPASLTGDTLWLDLGEATEIAEAEPNDTAAQAQPVALPGTLSGRIGKPGDVDRFAFTVKRNERFNFRVLAASLHSLLAARIRVDRKSTRLNSSHT